MSRRRPVVCLAVAAVALVTTLPVRAAQPQFWRIEGARDFLEGDSDGLSIDSEGRVRLAPATRALADTEAPYVWALARDGRGTLYAGTGNDGKVFKVDGAKSTVFYDAAELEVHALAAGPDGKLYVGTSPDGKVYAVDAAGKAAPFYDPTDKYIWALAFDRNGSLLVASGAEGRIARVDRQGKAQILLTSAETHITALLSDARSGLVYAGSSPGGILYRIDPTGKVFVLHDSPFREVRSLLLGTDGSLYAAVIDGKGDEPARRPEPPMPPMAPAATGGEVTVTESFTVVPPAGPVPAPLPTPRPTEPARAGGAKGAVLRIAPSGEVDTLWSDGDETPFAMAAAAGGVLVGTGGKGNVYRVHDDRTWTMVASFPGEQVTALQPELDGSILVATSNPGKLHVLRGRPGDRGTFTSKVRDTETVSSWGRLRWDGQVPEGTRIEIQTRSGNTSSPDTTWSDWSAAQTRSEGEAVQSESARFLQLKVTLIGREGTSPVLDSLSTAYLQRNLRPQVQAITVHPPGEVFQKPLSITGEAEILGLDNAPGAETRPGPPSAPPRALPPATSYSRKLFHKGVQTFSWRADDANGDTLAYDVFYRRVDDTLFRPLRKGLTDAVLAWDTTTVPNGRYVIRITASDAPSNPEALALTVDKESVSFEVDNTPPSVTASLVTASAARIRAVVRDDSSIVRRAEYSVDGGRWREVHPVDGINDALEEVYEIPTSELPPPGPHMVVVRATDLLGNVSTGRVQVP
ncbi:MAG TPA: PQQ-binding-like beta-propeller repeat protein [Vicinamibacteria bacterium]